MPRRPIHPACALWPRPSDDEVKALAADIKANGLLNPIWLFEGAVLDGKTRDEACEIAGVEPRFQTYEGSNPVEFTIAQNARRRQMSVYDLAGVVSKLCTLSHGGNRGNQYTGGKFSPENLALDEAAKQAGISTKTIADRKTLDAVAESNVIQMVKDKKVGMHTAAKYAQKTPREKQRTATIDDVKEQSDRVPSGPVVRRNKYGVPVGKRNVPVTILSKKTLAEMRKPQPMLTIPETDVKQKFRSLIRRVKEQSDKHPATVSFTALRIIAFELEQLADAWTENGAESRTHSSPVPLNGVHTKG